MAYALKFPPDVTEIIMSMRDWRYEMVRAGGKTPSARCLPEPIPLPKPGEPITTGMEPGKFYMSRIDYNEPETWLRNDYKTNGPVSIITLRLGMTSDGHSGRQPDLVLVRRFEDIVSANRVFG